MARMLNIPPQATANLFAGASDDHQKLGHVARFNADNVLASERLELADGVRFVFHYEAGGRLEIDFPAGTDAARERFERATLHGVPTA